MNTYLLGLISKWAGIISVTFSGILGVQTTEIENTNQTKNSKAAITELEYNTVTQYNDKIPSNITITKREGETGLAYTNETNKLVETIKNPVDRIIEVGTGDQGEFVGKMTGYGADCVGCNQTGTLSCKTKSGSKWSLIKNGEIYTDEEYGKVRILAASLNKFPCGTIIKVQNDNLGTFNAIVLDTGGAMRQAWSNGIVHMDLAFISETSKGINNVTNKNVKYSVQRWGW